MRTRTMLAAVAMVVTVVVVVLSPLSAQTPGRPRTADSARAQLERGKYLVSVGTCHDCHSPKVFTPKGPEPDPARLLSGHPADTKLPDIPPGLIAPDKWGALATNDLTAWAGPWGISFARNLTPDVETGLGSWTPAIFIKAIRTGKDMGEGRDILPPMPWEWFAKMSDQDLRAIFTYLRSLKPIKNAVPDPVSPTGQRLETLKPKPKP